MNQFLLFWKQKRLPDQTLGAQTGSRRPWDCPNFMFQRWPLSGALGCHLRGATGVWTTDTLVWSFSARGPHVHQPSPSRVL